MQWSPQQDAALKAVDTWLTSSDEQVYRLFGYAGTGKTTLAQHFAEGVAHPLFAAFTGKAAHVLRQKGCEKATTIHSLIYHPKDKSQARLRDLEADLAEARMLARNESLKFGGEVDDDPTVQKLQRLLEEERKNLSRPAFSLNIDSEVPRADLVVIDECSMVDGRMGQDLLSFDTKVLVLGDPAQLPPIGDGGFFTKHAPDFMLTEIHRQSADNPIIRLATDAREKRLSPQGEYGSSRVVAEVSPEEALGAGQILVGRNLTRHSSNRRIRQLLSLGSLDHCIPVPGDKLVCLRNNHDLGLLNGSLWHVKDTGDLGDDRILLVVEPLDGAGPTLNMIEAWLHPFEGRTNHLPWWERKEAEEFDYGYAMTVHKAQGSQFDDVLLFDESKCFRGDRWRWLYTGITRASERITIVRA